MLLPAINQRIPGGSHARRLITDNQPPVAAFTVEVDGTTVTVTDASTDPEEALASWDLDWGDGSPHATGPGPWVHEYSAIATFPLTLTVTDSGGLTAEASDSVTTLLIAEHVGTGSSTVDGTSFVTPSYSFKAGALAVICIASRSGGHAPPTVTGAGRTWALVPDATVGHRAVQGDLWVYESYAAGPTAGALSITLGTSATSMVWTVEQAPGSAAAVAQAAKDATSAADDVTCEATLAAPPGAGGISIGFASNTSANLADTTIDPGYSPLGSVQEGAQSLSLFSGYAAESQSFSATFHDDVACLAMVEVAVE